MMTQERYKIQKVRIVECPMLETEQPAKVRFGMLCDKLVRREVHQLHELPAFLNDGPPVTPRKDGREKAGDLDVLPAGERMRDADRVIGDERGPVVFGYFFVEKGLQLQPVRFS